MRDHSIIKTNNECSASQPTELPVQSIHTRSLKSFYRFWPKFAFARKLFHCNQLRQRECLFIPFIMSVLPNDKPSHEIMALFVLRKLILQTNICSHLVGLDVWFLVETFVYVRTSCVRTANALARLRGCAGSPEPSLVAYVVSTIIWWAGSMHATHWCLTSFSIIDVLLE